MTPRELEVRIAEELDALCNDRWYELRDTEPEVARAFWKLSKCYAHQHELLRRSLVTVPA
jgi:hypothetical protein